MVRKNGSVTIPASIRKAARLDEGDIVEVEITPDGILLRPKKLVDATQAWRWEPASQAGERAADEDLRADRFDRFESDDLVAAIEERMKPLDADA